MPIICKNHTIHITPTIVENIAKALSNPLTSANSIKNYINAVTANLRNYLPLLHNLTIKPQSEPVNYISIGCGYHCEELVFLSTAPLPQNFHYDGIEIDEDCCRIASMLYQNVPGIRIWHQDASEIHFNQSIKKHEYDLIIWRHPPYLLTKSKSYGTSPKYNKIIKIIHRTIPKLARISGTTLLVTFYTEAEREAFLQLLHAQSHIQIIDLGCQTSPYGPRCSFDSNISSDRFACCATILPNASKNHCIIL